MGKPIKVEMPNQIQSSVVVTVSETRIRGVSYSWEKETYCCMSIETGCRITHTLDKERDVIISSTIVKAKLLADSYSTCVHPMNNHLICT